MKKYILPIILILLLLWLAFDKVSNIGLTNEFKAKQDSLVHAVDSMKLSIVKDDAVIDSLNQVDSVLQWKLAHQKTKVVVIDHWVDSSKGKIDTYTEHELVSSFNNRYPKDTITNPLPLAQPVLVAAAKDLVELDGAKEKLIIKDTIIVGLESRITIKDSVIVKFESKEKTYQGIMLNQETQIQDWKDQFKKLQLQNAKLKTQSKFFKVGSFVVVGGLAYLLLK